MASTYTAFDQAEFRSVANHILQEATLEGMKYSQGYVTLAVMAYVFIGFGMNFMTSKEPDFSNQWRVALKDTVNANGRLIVNILICIISVIFTFVVDFSQDAKRWILGQLSSSALHFSAACMHATTYSTVNSTWQLPFFLVSVIVIGWIWMRNVMLIRKDSAHISEHAALLYSCTGKTLLGIVVLELLLTRTAFNWPPKLLLFGIVTVYRVYDALWPENRLRVFYAASVLGSFLYSAVWPQACIVSLGSFVIAGWTVESIWIGSGQQEEYVWQRNGQTEKQLQRTRHTKNVILISPQNRMFMTRLVYACITVGPFLFGSFFMTDKAKPVDDMEAKRLASTSTSSFRNIVQGVVFKRNRLDVNGHVVGPWKVSSSSTCDYARMRESEEMSFGNECVTNTIKFSEDENCVYNMAHMASDNASDVFQTVTIHKIELFFMIIPDHFQGKNLKRPQRMWAICNGITELALSDNYVWDIIVPESTHTLLRKALASFQVPVYVYVICILILCVCACRICTIERASKAHKNSPMSCVLGLGNDKVLKPPVELDFMIYVITWSSLVYHIAILLFHVTQEFSSWWSIAFCLFASWLPLDTHTIRAAFIVKEARWIETDTALLQGMHDAYLKQIRLFHNFDVGIEATDMHKWTGKNTPKNSAFFSAWEICAWKNIIMPVCMVLLSCRSDTHTTCIFFVLCGARSFMMIYFAEYKRCSMVMPYDWGTFVLSNGQQNNLTQPRYITYGCTCGDCWFDGLQCNARSNRRLIDFERAKREFLSMQGQVQQTAN